MPFDPVNTIRSILGGNSKNRNAQREPSFTDNVIAHMRNRGYAAANRYLLFVFPNQEIRNNLGMRFIEDTSRLALTCKSVSTVEQSWFTHEENFMNAAASRFLPYRKNSANTTGFKATYNCGADMFEKEFFGDWLNYIQDPVTKQFKFYEDYAKDSEAVVLILPNKVQNFNQAMEGFQKGVISGFVLTEIYPYSYTINGGNLSYAAATEPLTVEVGFMFREMNPLSMGKRQPLPNVIPQIKDTGKPTTRTNGNTPISNMTKATNGIEENMVLGSNGFNNDAVRQRQGFYEYMQGIQSYNLDGDMTVASDGREVNGLDLGLTILQQTQGFFGAGYFGNGWYP